MTNSGKSPERYQKFNLQSVVMILVRAILKKLTSNRSPVLLAQARDGCFKVSFHKHYQRVVKSGSDLLDIVKNRIIYPCRPSVFKSSTSKMFIKMGIILIVILFR